MTKPADPQPAAVPATATQAGSIRARWSWVEATVWTERMLTALEQGVKGGVWFSLIDKVFAVPTLKAAWAKVQANQGAAGIDGESVAMFARQADKHLRQLHEELRQGTYEPQPVWRAWIDKPGSTEQRPLGIPAVRDRVVQTALRWTLEPSWEAQFAEQSYGFRPGRGCKDALRRVDELLLTSDIIQLVADRKHVSFMYSYSNYIPLSGYAIERIVKAVEPWASIPPLRTTAGRSLPRRAHPEPVPICAAG
jgi:RNA-directed DNA polymerase